MGYVFRLKEIRDEAVQRCTATLPLPSLQSLTQHTASIVHKLVDLFQAHVAAVSKQKTKFVIYQKSCHATHDSQSNGLLVQNPGMQPLAEFVETLIHRMSTNDPNVLSEWYPHGNPNRHLRRWAAPAN